MIFLSRISCFFLVYEQYFVLIEVGFAEIICRYSNFCLKVWFFEPAYCCDLRGYTCKDGALLGLELKMFIWCRDLAWSLLILFMFDNEHEVFDKITASSLYLYFFN